MKTIALLVAGVALSLAAPHAVAAEVPAGANNVLFILADDLGWGDLSSHGNQHVRTP